MHLIIRFRRQDFMGPIQVLQYDRSDSAESHALGKNSMIRVLRLAQNFQNTEIELPLRAVSQVAKGNGNESELEPITPPRMNSTTPAFDPAPTQTAKSVPPPHATEAADGVENMTEDPQKTGIQLPSQTVAQVVEFNGNGPVLESVPAAGNNSPILSHDHASNLRKTETEPPPQTVGKIATHSENASDLEGIPVEEIDVEPISRIAFYTDPRGVAADRFRFLRMRIRELSDARKLKSLLVTSALPLDGKSTVSLNLATALAERGKSAVLLLEADLYHPTLAQRLGLKAEPGLAECLTSGVAPLSAVRHIQPLGWYFLPAGRQLADPSDLLHGGGFAHVMQALLPHFKWIVVDSPPVVPIADSLALARCVDASLLVVRAGQTPSDAVEKALESLGANHVMGVILNGVEGLDRLHSKYNKYYGPVAPTTTS